MTNWLRGFDEILAGKDLYEIPFYALCNVYIVASVLYEEHHQILIPDTVFDQLARHLLNLSDIYPSILSMIPESNLTTGSGMGLRCVTDVQRSILDAALERLNPPIDPFS